MEGQGMMKRIVIILLMLIGVGALSGCTSEAIRDTTKYELKGYTFNMASDWVGEVQEEATKEDFAVMTFEKADTTDKVLLIIDGTGEVAKDGQYISNGVAMSAEELVAAMETHYKNSGYVGAKLTTIATPYGEAYSEVEEGRVSIDAIYEDDLISVVGYTDHGTEELEVVLTDMIKSVKK